MAEEGSASIEIRAPADRVMRVITEIEAYPEWMDPFKRVEVLERDGQGRPARAQFEMDIVIKRLQYTLEYTYPDGGVAWRQAEGDMRELEGSYRLEPVGEGTRVTYAYVLDPGIQVPAFIMRQGVRLMVSTALGDLKKRAESLAG